MKNIAKKEAKMIENLDIKKCGWCYRALVFDFTGDEYEYFCNDECVTSYLFYEGNDNKIDDYTIEVI